MKLGKATILALIECACFAIGAIFFLLMLISPASPLWMLIVGILFGLTGALMWLYPYIARLFKKIYDKLKSTRAKVKDVSKEIQSINEDDETYELHRADSYENLTDDYFSSFGHNSQEDNQ